MSRKKPWYEDDSLWGALEPVLFDRARVDEAVLDVQDVVRLAGLEPGMSILDLCCGVGRHSIELASRGFSVTGVDRSSRFLEKASGSAAAAGVALELIAADMREFVRPTAFDAVINLWTSFGYFEDPADDARVLSNVLESLQPGGTFVMSLMGKEVLARIFAERHVEERDGLTIIQEGRISSDWAWIESTWTISGAGRKRRITVAHRLYSAVELKGLATSTGFIDVRAYGDLAGDPYDHRSQRLVLVARRPA